MTAMLTRPFNRFDPSKFIFEHYVDGDQMNSSLPTNTSKASPDSLHIWGMRSLSTNALSIKAVAHLDLIN